MSSSFWISVFGENLHNYAKFFSLRQLNDHFFCYNIYNQLHKAINQRYSNSINILHTYLEFIYLRMNFSFQELKKSVKCTFKVGVIVLLHYLVLKGIAYFTVILLSLVCLNSVPHKHRMCKTDTRQEHLFNRLIHRSDIYLIRFHWICILK